MTSASDPSIVDYFMLCFVLGAPVVPCVFRVVRDFRDMRRILDTRRKLDEIFGPDGNSPSRTRLASHQSGRSLTHS
jgi:hypothetical protein